MTMTLYMHPASTACRPVSLFIAEKKLPVTERVVDLMSGEHLAAPFTAINPSRLVPALEDGEFRLTECSAILKYLAEKVGSPAYPADLRRRARVNERMDWLNTGFYRDLGYGLIYPQILPHHRRVDDGVQAGTLTWGCARAKGWLKVLDEDLIGPNSDYLCGSEITLADYLGAAILTLGEVIHLDYAVYRNISRWLDTMKTRPSWATVNETFYADFVAPFNGASFVGL